MSNFNLMKPKTLLISTTNILLNNYFYQFLVFFFFLKGDFILISEITFLIAPLIFLKESFSANHRTLLLSDRRLSLYQIFVKQRIFYITVIAIIYFFYFFLFFKKVENIYFVIFIALLINYLWINELNLTFYETNLNRKKINKSLFILIILYMQIIHYMIFPNLILLYLLFALLFFLIIKNFNNYKFGLFYILNNIKIKYSFNYKLLSTTSINFVNLIWRIAFFLLLEKEFSGMLFAIFAFMSFPSSFYNNTIGMTLENYSSKKHKFQFALIIYYVSILSFIYYTYMYKIIPLNIENLANSTVMCVVFSFFGSLIMMFSISKRIKIIKYTKLKRNILFKIDIFYALANLFSIAIIYFYLGSELFYILFFISSIFSLSYYIYLKNLIFNEHQ